MGNICSSPQMSQEKDEITFQMPLKRYKSTYDNIYDRFDKNFNVLKYIPLNEYLLMLNIFKSNQNMSASTNNIFKRVFFLQEVEKESAICFFEHKVLSNHLLTSDACKEKPQIFKDFVRHIYDCLVKGYMSYVKNKNQVTMKSSAKMKIKKLILMALGFMYCCGDLVEKVEILHYVFSNESNKLHMSDNFDAFLYFLFLISSYGMMKAIHELSKVYTEIHSSEEAILKAYDVYEVSDIIKLKDECLNQIFFGSPELTLEELLDKVKSLGLDWILSPSGVRLQLEQSHTG